MASVRPGSFCLALLSLGFFAVSTAAADTISTWNGGSGNWSNAAQWNPAIVPNNNGSQAYDVSISNGTASLDTSPTINSLTLNGSLTTGFDPSTGQYPTLTVNRNVTVNGGISGSPAQLGLFNSLAIGGNLTNPGYIKTFGSLTVGGNLTNSGFLGLTGSVRSGFSVGGTLSNTGALVWGAPEYYYPGPGTSLGGLVNSGSIFVEAGTIINVTHGVVDVPKQASYEIAGTLNAFSGLKSIEGPVIVEGDNTFGSVGNTMHNFASFTIGTTLSAPVTATVVGNFVNSGKVVVATEGESRPDLGPSTLNVVGTFTNRANGTLNINNPQFSLNSPGALTAQTLINYGTASFQAGTTSTVGTLINNGTLNIFGADAGDIGKLTVGTLEPVSGVIHVWDTAYPHLISPGVHPRNVSLPLPTGGALIVGSGTLPSGFSGYYQFANGILEEAGGSISVFAPIDLNGTLDVLLGDGYKPVGTVFDVITGGQVTGTFSNVEGLVFDDGREHYILDYGGHSVTLTVENSTTPEPASAFLISLGLAGIIVAGIARERLIAQA